MRGLTINLKLILLIISSLLLLSIITLSVSVFESIQHSKEDKLEQLSSITAAKKQHIENYFNRIEGLIVSTASAASTGDAFKYMGRYFYKIKDETSMDITVDKAKKEVRKHYEQHYINRINFDLSGVSSKKPVEHYLPKIDDAILAQYMYIVKNEAPVGKKNIMIESSTLTSSYTLNHTKFHETYNTILEKFRLADIFFVDKKGTVIYSAFKEKDYATNLKTGAYSNSGLAQVNEKAQKLKKGEVSFVDFKPYEANYNKPSSFIATPVFNKRGKRVGNLVFQFPIDVIDEIMNFEGKFEEAGLGNSGNSYLVGPDHTMRNDYRFIKQVDNQNTKSSGTTVGFLSVKSKSTAQALVNKTGAHEIVNFRGEEVLSSYSSVNVFGQNWAIISEINLDEALAPTIELNIILALISLVVLIAIILVTIVALRNSVIRPLKKFEDGLVGFFSYLNNETHEVVPLDDSANDEIGNMSHVINKNIHRVKQSLESDRELLNETVQVLSEFEKGDLCQRITKSSSNPALNELKDVLNNMGNNLEFNIENILAILEQYTHYNYLNKVDTQGLKEHLLKLATGVNSLGDAITQTLVENKTNGLKLDQSSDILIESVRILSNNTNEAAASIEQTSAALEQINSNVEANNQNVDNMSSYAQEVTVAVKEGETLANKTTVAMDEINVQVSSINDAITVIDKIAFQTNILSLNAAVEAATAGEAGKGFAVVAQEVRNLAGRSAQAAKEIKALVTNANVKANEGKVIADSMIEGYSTLSNNINNTIELINSVSTASKEQQLGIQQVSDAVSQLDRQTQENAAIAQNTNAVASDTDKISKRVVSNANAKEFHGKNEIKIKKAKEKKILKKTLKAFSSGDDEKIKALKKQKKKGLEFNGIKPKVKDAKIHTNRVFDEDDAWESF